jgi:hypothetical protein
MTAASRDHPYPFGIIFILSENETSGDKNIRTGPRAFAGGCFIDPEWFFSLLSV